MAVLSEATVLVTGFVGCAEFSSVAFVHPVARRLPLESRVILEKGLLRTFGRVMPVGMTLAPILAGLLAAREGGALLVVASAVLALALLVTILGNVPVNVRTGRITTSTAPDGFEAMRSRWEVLQAVRGSLQILGFVLVVLGVVGPA
ncbi:anthrone oxygenase family protein [Brachybacterium sp. ACRRE]|uniref:anthrone oxygenase family protein n=1 Tax=Brachybacterium sp. ACRRE TaxID=2918184 RepID=UPI001EF34BB1|nr:DUF1772 domain-containing protein [Brachybacterium sp. ACRRE]